VKPEQQEQPKPGLPNSVKIILWQRRIADLESSDVFPHISKRLVNEAREKIKELKREET